MTYNIGKECTTKVSFRKTGIIGEGYTLFEKSTLTKRKIFKVPENNINQPEKQLSGYRTQIGGNRMGNSVGVIAAVALVIIFLAWLGTSLGHNSQAANPQMVTIDNGKITTGQGADSPANQEAQKLAVASGEVQVKKMDKQNLETEIEMEEMRAAAEAKKAANMTMPPMNVYVVMPDGSKIAAKSSNNSNSTVDNTTT